MVRKRAISANRSRCFTHIIGYGQTIDCSICHTYRSTTGPRNCVRINNLILEAMIASFNHSRLKPKMQVTRPALFHIPSRQRKKHPCPRIRKPQRTKTQTRSISSLTLEILHQLLLIHLSSNLRINIDWNIHARRRIRRQRMLVLRSDRLHICGRVVVRRLRLRRSRRWRRGIKSLRGDEAGLACVDCAGGGVAHCAAVSAVLIFGDGGGRGEVMLMLVVVVLVVMGVDLVFVFG